MITYEEKIKREAKKDNPDAQWLALELLLNVRTLKLYEKKLQEIMSKEEFEAFSTEVAKKVFRQSVEELHNEEFKQFVFDNWDYITGADDE